MIAAATPTGALDGLPVFIVLLERLLGLASVNPCAGTCRRRRKEPLARHHAARDVLKLLTFVFRRLRCRQNHGHHATLVTPRKVMDERMAWVHLPKGRDNSPIEPLNESIANADRVAFLRQERTRRIQQPLIIVEDRRRQQLTVRADRRLANVLQDSVRLVAVSRTELDENRSADLPKP